MGSGAAQPVDKLNTEAHYCITRETLRNPFSHVPMNFLTHPRALLLNPNPDKPKNPNHRTKEQTRPKCLKQFRICPLTWAINFARMGG